MARSQGSFSSNRSTKYQYVCVECGAPCDSLYYKLSASSIKALACSNCGQIADPYIEQEWLLIVIDCILFRVEAYRHVLFNADEVKLFTTRKLIGCGLVWSVLDSYLKWETNRIINQDDTVVDPLLYSTLFIGFLIASSFLGLILEYLIILFYMKSKWKEEASTSLMSQKNLFLALLLPSSFVVITMLVLMWENTRTVLLLGSLMITCWKAVAISVVSRDFWAPCIGLLVRLIWHMLQKPVPCTGLEFVLEPSSLKLCFP